MKSFQRVCVSLTPQAEGMEELMDTSEPPGGEVEGGGALAREFKAWLKQEERKIIQLEEVTRDEEGKASIQFTIEGSQEFTLHCPTSYPDYQVPGQGPTPTPHSNSLQLATPHFSSLLFTPHHSSLLTRFNLVGCPK